MPDQINHLEVLDLLKKILYSTSKKPGNRTYNSMKPNNLKFYRNNLPTTLAYSLKLNKRCHLQKKIFFFFNTIFSLILFEPSFLTHSELILLKFS
jgi:hypothetical protein